MKIERVDYQNPAHAQALIEMLNHYAEDPMGGGESLSESTREKLIQEMAKRPSVFSFMAWDEQGQAIGFLLLLRNLCVMCTISRFVMVIVVKGLRNSCSML